MAGLSLPGSEAATTVLYRGLLDRHLYQTLGSMQLDHISPAAVRAWHSRLDTGPTRRAHAYSLLRTILNTAVADDLIPANPCRLRGAGQSQRVRDIRPASLDELTALTEAMPGRLRLIVLLAAWCGLRFGELVELRRKDIDTKEGALRVRRAVTWVDGKRPRRRLVRGARPCSRKWTRSTPSRRRRSSARCWQ